MLLRVRLDNVNYKESSGRTPLLFAANREHSTIVKLLLTAKNIEIDSKDRYGATPLWDAVENGHDEVVELLLASGKVHIHTMDDSGDLLLRAAKGRHYTIVKLLLASDEAGICWTQKYGRAAQQLTALAGHETIMKC
jgi:ankyrin repeat protein